MRLAYKMEYIYPTEEDTGIEMVNYSSQYSEYNIFEFVGIINYNFL